MIDRIGPDEFDLTCDHCEETAEDTFSEFQDAVDYKKENSWKSIKDDAGSWHDLCPTCQSPDIIRKVKEGGL